jgi:hypothetical protein
MREGAGDLVVFAGKGKRDGGKVLHIGRSGARSLP